MLDFLGELAVTPGGKAISLYLPPHLPTTFGTGKSNAIDNF